MQEVLSLSIPFFGLIFLGFLVGKLIRQPESGLAWLNIFILYVALPALFFTLLSETPIEELDNVGFIAATTFATYTAFCLAFLLGAIRTCGDIPKSTIHGLAGGYANNGYLGPGLAITALGAEAAVPVALVFCFDNTMFFVLTPILMAIGGQETGTPRAMAAKIARRILTHPFIVATALGILAAAVEFRPPAALDKLLEMLTAAAAPCALFAMGVTVALRPTPKAHEIPDISALLAIKLVVHPLLAWALLTWVGGVDPLWVAAAILLAALPPATNVFVLATQYRTLVERASNIVLLGTAVSVVTVTGLLYLITNGMLPIGLP